jgi:hypothetical protein
LKIVDEGWGPDRGRLADVSWNWPGRPDLAEEENPATTGSRVFIKELTPLITGCGFFFYRKN